jgi:hypothetical protein
VNVIASPARDDLAAALMRRNYAARRRFYLCILSAQDTPTHNRGNDEGGFSVAQVR